MKYVYLKDKKRNRNLKKLFNLQRIESILEKPKEVSK
jgi:hypothetical protein